jgi:diguanylate cyclase (GGDEF)-like protein/PAS domain S-box-containing protein
MTLFPHGLASERYLRARPLRGYNHLSLWLALLAMLPLFLLLISVRMTQEASVECSDVNQAGSLRSRSLLIYGLTHQQRQNADWRPILSQMVSVRTSLRDRHPREVAQTDAAWSAFCGSLQHSGRVDWQTALLMRDASDRLTQSIEDVANNKHGHANTLMLAGIAATAAFVGLALVGAWQGIRAARSQANTEETLRERDAHLHGIVTAAAEGIYFIDRHGACVFVNPAVTQMLGYSEEELHGNNVHILTHHSRKDGSPYPLVECPIYSCLHSGIPNRTCNEVFWHKDGTPIPVEYACNPIIENGQVAGVVVCIQDITERAQAEQALRDSVVLLQTRNKELDFQRQALESAREQNSILESLATTDGLTGIKNHRALHERLWEEYERALRYNTPLSVLMLDVDKFKQYNDAYGHPAGDVVLRQVARILQEAARSSDIVARYGGEEFVVVLPGANVEEAKIVAERLRCAIERAAWPEQTVTISIGAATLSPATLHADALLASADTALYRSKRRGRNCVTHAADPVDIEALDTETTRWYDDLLQQLLAAQAESLASTSVQAREALFQAYDTTLVSWSRFLNLKDKETEGHSERVTAMMVRLMQHLAFSEQEIMFARWGALLHDIGKIAIPDVILHKPGPLTEEEWVIMRQHTTIAYEMLQPIAFLGPALDIPYCHHEKWDGSGYPRGLKGDEIPLMARLFAVIDVYDALISDRPYRRGWSEDRARAYLLEQVGTHFDPRAVTALLTMLGEANRLPDGIMAAQTSY